LSDRRPLTRGFVLGAGATIVACVVAATLAFLATRAILDDDDSPPPQPEPVPGAKVVGLTEPLEYGDWRFLPPGTEVTPCDPEPPEGAAKESVTSQDADSLEEVQDHDLFLDPPYLPEGASDGSVHTETIVWDDGSRTGSQFNLIILMGEGELPIQLSRTQLGANCKLEYEEPPDQTEADPPFVLDELRGEPIYYRGRIWVEVIIDHVVTRVATLNPNITTDTLTDIMEGIIEDLQAKSESA
jgi:hypothetical protein